MSLQQRRQNGIKTGRYGEDIGSESAITSFLGISFNNSELCDGKLSVSGFMDDSWYIFGSSDGNGSKIYELTGPPTGGALLEMV